MSEFLIRFCLGFLHYVLIAPVFWSTLGAGFNRFMDGINRPFYTPEERRAAPTWWPALGGVLLLWPMLRYLPGWVDLAWLTLVGTLPDITCSRSPITRRNHCSPGYWPGCFCAAVAGLLLVLYWLSAPDKSKKRSNSLRK